MIDELTALVRESARLAGEEDWGPRALAVNQRIVELQPSALGAVARLAGCLHAAGRHDEALELDRRVAAEGSPLDSKVARRRIAEHDERRRAAVTQSWEAAQARSKALREAARPELAMIWHARALELAGSPSERAIALASQASTLRNLLRFEEAEATARRAVDCDPRPAANLAGYAAWVGALVDVGDLYAAQRQADELLRAHPRSPIALNAAGRAFHELARRTGNEDFARRATYCFAAASR